MTEYNITLELAKRNPTDDDVDVLIDAFEAFHPTISTSPLGWTEVTITVQAENLRQAVATGLGLAGDVVSVTGMTTKEFDQRPVHTERMPKLVSVTEAAELLRITPQAVRQKLAAGHLPGTKVGGTWWLPAAFMPKGEDHGD